MNTKLEIKLPGEFKEQVRHYIRVVFGVALLSFLGYNFIEVLSPGFVSIYFNMNILSWFLGGAAIPALLWPSVTAPKKQIHRAGKLGPWFQSCIGIFIAIFILYQLRAWGRLVIVVAPLFTVVILLISWLAVDEEDLK